MKESDQPIWERERTYIMLWYHLSSPFVDDEEPFAARGKIPMPIFICGTLPSVEPFNQKMINTDSSSDGTKTLTLTFHWYYLWQVNKHKNAFLNGNRHFPQPRQLLLRFCNCKMVVRMKWYFLNGLKNGSDGQSVKVDVGRRCLEGGL